MLKTNYEFLFVGRDEGAFLENYSYDLVEDHGEKAGRLFITVEVQNNPADAEEIAEGMFDVMRSQFFMNLDSNPYDRFENALKHVNKFLNSLKGEKVSSYIGNLNVLIGVVVGDQLHLTQAGDAEAYLVRKNFITVVSEGLNEEGGENIFADIASGSVEEGDFVVFSSTRLLRYVSKTDLAKILNAKDPIGSLSEVKDLISTEILGKVAIIGMTFENVVVSEPVEQAVNIVERSVEQTLAEPPRRKRLFSLRIPGIKLPKISIPSIKFKLPELAQKSDTIKSFFSGGFTKDKILGVLIMIILILIFGIWYAKNSAEKREEIEALDATLNQVREQVAVAETKGQYDKKAAGVILSKAEESAVKVLNSGYHRAKANEVLNLIQTTRDSIDSVRRVEEPKVLADLSAKRENVNALGMLHLRDQFFVYEYNALYEVVLDKVEDPIVLDDKETILFATDFEDQDALMFMTKTGQLIQYKDGNISFMDSSEGKFHSGTAVTDWGNRIYILDPAGDQIWRYPYSSTRDIFATTEEYNVDGNIKNAVSFAIDSAIWLLKNNGEIEKLYGGKHEDFTIEREPFFEFDKPSKIYTDGEFNQLFVLDSGSSRVFIYGKDLKTGNLAYISQLVFPSLSDLRDLYVDKDSNKLYLLDAKKVYEVGL